MSKAKNTKNNTAKEAKYQAVNDKLIALLEQEIKPWERPWAISQCGNLITGHQYRGVNPIICQIDMLDNGWEHPSFVSFNQAKKKGWSIKKGSKATSIVWASRFKISQKEEDGDHESEKIISTAKWYNLFNVACIDDSKGEKKIADFLPDPNKFTNPDLPIAEIEEFLSRWEVETRHGGDRAFYRRSQDFIQMPDFKKFTSAEAYYAVRFHEMGHSTNHTSRLNREKSGRFGTITYAREELVAELTAVYLGIEFGLQKITTELEEHANYLKGWISLLKSDSKAFFKASRQAQLATNYILARCAPEKICDRNNSGQTQKLIAS